MIFYKKETEKNWLSGQTKQMWNSRTLLEIPQNRATPKKCSIFNQCYSSEWFQKVWQILRMVSFQASLRKCTTKKWIVFNQCKQWFQKSVKHECVSWKTSQDLQKMAKPKSEMIGQTKSDFNLRTRRRCSKSAWPSSKNLGKVSDFISSLLLWPAAPLE